jgi:hypothetical protein
MTPLDKQARMAGFYYLLLVFVGPLRLMYIPSTLFVPGDATATMANIASHETLWRLGMASDVVATAILIAMTLALYQLFERVDRTQAVMVVVLGGIMPGVMDLMTVALDATVFAFASGADYLKALDAPQREAMGYAFLKLNGAVTTASELLWGLWLFPLALLTWRSRFLPKFLGAWLAINGLAYVVLCLVGVLAPQYNATLFNAAFPAMLGEVAFVLWLLIRGAKEPATVADGASR